MNILILGSGGREHALAWAIKQNPKCDHLIVAPGNAGVAQIADCADLDLLNGAEISEFCVEQAIDFVIIGPEAPLAAAIADELRSAGLLTFGPSAASARLETSKSFTKEICQSCNAPTAAAKSFTNEKAAVDYIRDLGAPIVIKADGLAAGKGVVVAETLAQALAAVSEMFGGKFGQAGGEVLIEEFMDGEEASLFVLCHGVSCLAIGTAQDHKRAFDGDLGPNTGGMGAYSPAPVLTAKIETQVMSEIIRPTLVEMERRGTPFQGVLYAGLMIKDGSARLVEYNVRFGDPECQVVMMRLGAQILDLLLACAENRLEEARIDWADDHAICVVMASKGYPEVYQKGSEIHGLSGLEFSSKRMVFHAGTSLKSNQIVATGGRVLNITARERSLDQARQAAYEMLAKIDWPDGFYRKDIGWRAL